MANYNKVKFGLSKVYYAIITDIDDDGNVTFAKPVPIPGAVNLSLEPTGSSDPFYADNGVYFMPPSSGGYEGDLEMAMIPDDFLTDVLGMSTFSGHEKNNAVIEKSMAATKEFALMFRFEGDKNKIHHCMYRCSATKPAVSSATTEDSIEVQTETVTITAMPLPNGVVKYKDKDTDAGCTDATFYAHVPGASYSDTANEDGTIVIHNTDGSESTSA